MNAYKLYTFFLYDLFEKDNDNIITSWPPGECYYCFVRRSSYLAIPGCET